MCHLPTVSSGIGVPEQCVIIILYYKEGGWEHVCNHLINKEIF